METNRTITSIIEIQQFTSSINSLVKDIWALNDILNGDCTISNDKERISLLKCECTDFINSLMDEKFKILNKKLHNFQQYNISIKDI